MSRLSILAGKAEPPEPLDLSPRAPEPEPIPAAKAEFPSWIADLFWLGVVVAGVSFVGKVLGGSKLANDLAGLTVGAAAIIAGTRRLADSFAGRAR